MSAGVWLSSVGLRNLAVDTKPFVQAGVGRRPGEGSVITVADSDNTSGFTDPAHLPTGGHRVGQVLEHLVGVDHVEAIVGEVQLVHVAQVKAGIGGVGAVRRLSDDLAGAVDAYDDPWGDPRGEIDRNRAGAATNVEEIEPWTE
jgi:hypothetical protein